MKTVKSAVLGILLIVAGVAKASAIDAVLDCNRIHLGEKTWTYLTPESPSTHQRALIMVSRPKPNGPFVMRTIDSVTKRPLATGMLYVDAHGRIARIEGTVSTNAPSKAAGNGTEPARQAGSQAFTYQYKDGRVIITLVDSKGNQVKEFPGNIPAIDSGALFFLIGGLNLDEVGQDETVRMIISANSAIRTQNVTLRVSQRANITSAARTFDAYAVQMKIGGLIGLLVPKITAWIDRKTRMLLRLELPKNMSVDLVQIK